ncbi:MAG: 4Fe-4S binding protein [Armatimonadota bacterium]
MCEFCHQHGEGRKWYLQASNYSQDLLSDVRRRRGLKKFLSQPMEAGSSNEDQFQKLDRLPGFVRGMVSAGVTRHMKRWHFGQVLPLEDVETVFGFVNTITRIPCICRKVRLGKEARYCYGITVGVGDALGDIMKEIGSSFDTSGPDGGEQLDAVQALQAFSDHEKEGLCHSVWTFGTPFIGGICNCDRSDCFAMQSTVIHGIKSMFRGETVAEASPDLCTGCRSCMRLCQFGALGFSAATKKVFIDQSACYGCGVCRAACQKQAISLKPRAEVPAAANLW